MDKELKKTIDKEFNKILDEEITKSLAEVYSKHLNGFFRLNDEIAQYGRSGVWDEEKFSQAMNVLHPNLKTLPLNIHFYQKRRDVFKSLFNPFLGDKKGRFVSLFSKKESHFYGLYDSNYVYDFFFYEYLIPNSTHEKSLELYSLHVIYSIVYAIQYGWRFDNQEGKKKSIRFSLRMVEKWKNLNLPVPN